MVLVHAIFRIQNFYYILDQNHQVFFLEQVNYIYKLVACIIQIASIIQNPFF